MTRKRFSPEQIVAFQTEVARGARIADVARKYGFSSSTFRRWRERFGTPLLRAKPTDAQRAEGAAWRKEKTFAKAWERFHRFASWWDEDPARGYAVDLPLELDDAYQAVDFFTSPNAKRVVVVHKGSSVAAMVGGGNIARAEEVAVVDCPMLPTAWTYALIRDHADRLGAPLAYFGDLDVDSLHRFAALRCGGSEALHAGAPPAQPVAYLGMDDAWLDHLAAIRGQAKDIPRSLMISFPWLEHEYWDLLKRFVPDLPALIGSRATRLLDSGARIEMDVLLWSRGSFESAMRERIQRSWPRSSRRRRE
jgi:hypothetical protein